MKKTTTELRALRKAAKKATENLDQATKEQIEKVRKALPSMSATGYMFCKQQMKKMNLEGLPGLDMKTYNGWKNFGFTVKKGEKSKVQGIVWLKVEKDDSDFMLAKQYALFHTSQVEQSI